MEPHLVYLSTFIIQLLAFLLSPTNALPENLHRKAVVAPANLPRQANTPSDAIKAAQDLVTQRCDNEIPVVKQQALETYKLFHPDTASQLTVDDKEFLLWAEVAFTPLMDANSKCQEAQAHLDAVIYSSKSSSQDAAGSQVSKSTPQTITPDAERTPTLQSILASSTSITPTSSRGSNSTQDSNDAFLKAGVCLFTLAAPALLVFRLVY